MVNHILWKGKKENLSDFKTSYVMVNLFLIYKFIILPLISKHLMLWLIGDSSHKIGSRTLISKHLMLWLIHKVRQFSVSTSKISKHLMLWLIM